jgi:uncharacterized protein (TIGR02271 family)
MREEVSVEKHPVTTEEVIIGKRTVEENQTVGGTVRKERARIEKDDTARSKESMEGR